MRLTPATPAPALHLPDVLAFMQVLWRVVHAAEQVSKRLAVEQGVTGPQRLVLRVLGLSPGMSAGALAATLHLHPSTLTGVLRRLEGRGLVSRAADAADRRRAVLRLTAKGRRLNALRRGTVEAAIRDALADLTARERASGQQALARIADRMESRRPRR
jgi:DNA-binding MarR family transcriptional regulator